LHALVEQQKSPVPWSALHTRPWFESSGCALPVQVHPLVPPTQDSAVLVVQAEFVVVGLQQ
jgi:hypothetical protein